MALDDLVAQYGPDIQSNAEYGLKLSKLLKSDDSHALYFLPGGVQGTDFGPIYMSNGWNLRWDLYKKLGKPRLETLDDLLAVLQAMKELEPTNKDGKDNYGLGLFLGESWGSLMIDKATANMKGAVALGPDSIYYHMDTQTLSPRYMDPDSLFWYSVRFYNQAYQLGILDPESVVLKYQTMMDKAKSGRYFAASANWALGGADNQFVADNMPEKGYAPFLIDHDKENIYSGSLDSGGNIFDLFISWTVKSSKA